MTFWSRCQTARNVVAVQVLKFLVLLPLVDNVRRFPQLSLHQLYLQHLLHYLSLTPWSSQLTVPVGAMVAPMPVLLVEFSVWVGDPPLAMAKRYLM